MPVATANLPPVQAVIMIAAISEGPDVDHIAQLIG